MQFGDEKCFFWALYRFGGLDPTENIYKREQTQFCSDEFETAVQVQLEYYKTASINVVKLSIIGIDFENNFFTEIYSEH